MAEDWRPIPGFDGYEMDGGGRIRSWRTPGHIKRAPHPKHVAPFPAKSGYFVLALRRDGKAHRFYLHHLVALVFHGPRPDGMWVLHEDDDRTNNRPGNLYYGTPGQNKHDAIRNGRLVVGSQCSHARLRESDIEEIRRLLADGRTQRVIAERFGICQQMVSRINKGQAWRHA